uniref:F-box domain-containing protein n=1 Tax=Kalanchoe fedtschenkoi TaxID=63787 RepID=A0A7N0REI5_KALFE
MALGRRCRVSRGKNGAAESDEVIGFGAVRATRGLGRKRVGISKEEESESCSSGNSELELELGTPLKRQCSEKFELLESDMSPLEALPQELLIRVLCGVEHADLKQLMIVSKPVMEAALVAKRMHFAYSTPTKVRAFHNPVEMDESGSSEEVEAPNAPRKWRARRRRISLKTKEDLAVSLFQSDDGCEEEKWPRRGLSFMDEDGC